MPDFTVTPDFCGVSYTYIFDPEDVLDTDGAAIDPKPYSVGGAND